MADLKLINEHGVATVYSGVEAIIAPTEGGDTAAFTIGSLAASKKDVNFYDYDGTIIASYTAAEFAALSALPDNPSHDGLTAQGWNYTLADAKAYVAANGKLDVGQMYVTDDRKTRIHIRLEAGRLAPYLGIAINGTATVDWGDGSTGTVTGNSTSAVVNTKHTYAAPGDYVIAISVSGSMALLGDGNYGSQVLWKNSTTANQNRVYQNSIQKIEIGENTSIGAYAFLRCSSLTTIVIPYGVTSIGTYAFSNCFSLEFVSVPNSVTSIGSVAFAYCQALVSVVLPSSLETLDSSLFNGCGRLRFLVIPNSVSSVSNALAQSCGSLMSVVIPEGVTSVNQFAFTGCFSLTSVVIPRSVASLGTYAFQNCNGLGSVKFSGSTPPTVSSTSVWANLPTDCIIYVPRGSLTAYTSAANYPSSSTYTYTEYDP